MFRHSRCFSTSVKFPKRRGELLYGFAPCLAALQAKRRKVYSIFTQEDVSNHEDNKKRHRKSLLAKQIKLYEKKDTTKILSISGKDMTRLIGKKPHQGIVLDVEPLSVKTTSVGNLLKFDADKHQQSSFPVMLMLYQVQDPMNFGAILRCAYFLGVDKIITSYRNSCGLTSVVSKASSGAMEFMPVHSVTDVPDLLKQAVLGDWSVLCACSDPPKQSLPMVSCADVRLHRPTILVLGSEGYGLPNNIVNSCTSSVFIPPLNYLPHGFDSLNVSVAAGIILHRLLHKN